MSERHRCCVPFCQRTVVSKGATEVICAKHWLAAERDLRRRYKAEQKRLADLVSVAADDTPSDARDVIIRDWRWLGVMWGEIKRQAIERALGI